MTRPIGKLGEKLACSLCGGISNDCDRKPLNTKGIRYGACGYYVKKAGIAIQTFGEWCEKEHIVQVVEGELPHELSSPYLEANATIASTEWMKGAMLEWHKDSLKPVSSLLGGEK